MKNKINYDNSENQEIKSKFVQREVKTCFSYEMDAILKVNGSCDITSELPSYDDIENYYEGDCCPSCGEKLRLTEDHFFCDFCEEEINSNDVVNNPQEIFEWWIVTDFLYRKLKAHDEPVLEWGNNYYWGRTCTGQSIMLDYVIGRICEDMEILEGQKYSWAKKKGV